MRVWWETDALLDAALLHRVWQDGVGGGLTPCVSGARSRRTRPAARGRPLVAARRALQRVHAAVGPGADARHRRAHAGAHGSRAHLQVRSQPLREGMGLSDAEVAAFEEYF